ncbi:hypothetical protein [Pedobacter gandavensis]|uniref:hypothetical protein n=1 Tax=Pedobacter gandavensis TaxID=2679963 RepID=UPI00293016F3|nr:hypothetical protein [Pedobacter gandavensis]
MKSTLQLLSLVILLLLNACQSPLSEQKVTSLSPIGVRIEMRQDLDDQKKNGVVVRLFDEKGYTIVNEGIKLKVNQLALEFNVRKELYYTTTTTYIANDIPVSPLYKFTITLADGRTYNLGNLQPIAESSEKSILCAKRGDPNKDFVISWNDLKDVNELSIMKSVLLNTSTKRERNYDYESIVTKKIGPAGQYIVPKSAYVDSISTIAGLEIKFIATKKGRLNPQLLGNSTIVISGHHDKNVNFEDED